MPSTILVVEDDPNVAELARLYLVHDGHEVLIARDGAAGLRLALNNAPDLIVLDLMLPKLDGLDICSRVRERSDVPILMLTARVEETDKLLGLETGADDYVTKPFSPRELAARVRAILRRTARDALDRGPEVRSAGGVRADIRKHAAWVEGRPLHLTRTEFRILALLLRDPGRTFSRNQIIDAVYGYDFESFERAVDSQIYNLRRKLGKGPNGTGYIHTVYGRGYRFDHA
ncbi:MAG: response regulator transcription factor [Gemmatimonadota bacterium]|nr:response regulator transcription factor [Gemmatimonadota bacterium]MXY78566.1 response regulator transcription factor [Chloroflexota bacterium]